MAINVRINSRSPARVSGTTTFVGSSNAAAEANLALQLAQTALTTANAALNIANSAIDTANTKVNKAGDTMTGSLVINGDITANNANFNQTVTLIDGGIFS